MTFGQGRFQKRSDLTITNRTPFLGNEVAGRKDLANRVLAEIGLPIPRQAKVRGADEAIAFAERFGYPVVLKPSRGSGGRLVIVGLTDSEGVAAAYQRVARSGRNVLIETFIEGFDHRILVMGGEVVAVAKRVPGHVVGDGRNTVETLVKQVNKDPRRGPSSADDILVYLKLDDEADRMLAKLGYDRRSVPAAGQAVYLRGTGEHLVRRYVARRDGRPSPGQSRHGDQGRRRL